MAAKICTHCGHLKGEHGHTINWLVPPMHHNRVTRYCKDDCKCHHHSDHDEYYTKEKMGIQNRSAAYKFNTSSSVDLDEFLEELEKAKQLFNSGGHTKLSISFSHYAGDQRDPSYFTFNISKKPGS